LILTSWTESIGVLQIAQILWDSVDIEADIGATGALKSHLQTGQVLLQLDEIKDS
jgi:hypothetical protein